MGEREELLRLAYLKLMDAVELLQRVGEDLLADQTEGIAAKVGRSALATTRAQEKKGAPGQGHTQLRRRRLSFAIGDEAEDPPARGQPT
jgi:hypothetical protein